MFSKKVIRIISIIMAALMILSVGAVLLQVIAVDEAVVLKSSVNTGENDLDYIIPIALMVVSALAVVACIILPKLKKKEK
ncbi:MAG: hypothetical protein IJ262_05545 [Clostridia bacterium]|nr:hypothetical protein [Clostridia bacterium]